MEIECASAVAKVVVHARGALVTREVTLPADLPSGVVDLVVPGLTLAAQPGSVRAALVESERVVSAVRSNVVVPSSEARRGPSVTKLEELTARRVRLEDELGVLTLRRKQLGSVTLAPNVRAHDSSKRGRDTLDTRFAETIAMSKLLGAKTTELDERILRLERERRELGHAIDAARLDDLQTSTKDRQGEGQPSRRVVVRVTGEGGFGRLSITYAVSAARWWPAYTLRIEDGGDRASWFFEALVAQKTGEDWAAAHLALSSADLLFDARLPELPSLRLGRAQAPKRRPPRPAPAGVEEMFAAYDAFRPEPPKPPPPKAASTLTGGVAPSPGDEPVLAAMAPQFQQQDTKKRAAVAPARAGGGGAPPGGMPPLQSAPMPMAMPMAASAPDRLSLMGSVANAFGGAPGEQGAFEMEDADGYGIGVHPESEPELVAGAQWSDLDALVLAGPDDARRGKLVPQPRSGDAGAPAVRELDGLARDRWIDPGVSRGMFDHRYEAMGRADVPSDGRVHRVGVATAACNVLISWRTVPSESSEVYREANVINPFEQALLGGPVDVYLDGSLLAETKMDRIDRGGTLWCGMGVDDRVKVARNVRVDEESAGLLGGSLAVTHTVGIELSSSIAVPVKVVVLERVPVTDDKNIEIKVVKASPAPAAYDQSDRGAPVRGGYRFEVSVTPGKKVPLEIVYRLVFASKLDIVGGSRRG